MQINITQVESNIQIGKNTYLIKVYAPVLASEIKPGQFCNIKVSDTSYPLLRRPFSICDVEGDFIFFMFDVHGEGTKILAEKKKGDKLDILGPLGNGFTLDGDFQIAVIVAGGIGVAPFPYFIRLLKNKKNVISYLGGKSKDNVITYGIGSTIISTDDGSEGYKGTVIDLLENEKEKFAVGRIKIFGCGPNPMLRSLREFCIINNLECEVSTEAAMACGFGICQGCPVSSSEKDKYHLVCKDGPVFNIKDIEL